MKKKISKLAYKILVDGQNSIFRKLREEQSIRRRIKGRDNCLAYDKSSHHIINSQIESEQNKREYKPLKTGWFNKDLQMDWQEFISRYDYDMFVTLTFIEDIDLMKAEQRFHKWLGSLNCSLFGWRYKLRGRGIRYAVVYEYQKRGTLHIHALLGAEGLLELSRKYMAKLWECNGQRIGKNGPFIDRIVNGNAVIKIYDPTRGAIQYLTKHIYKDVYIDMFIPRNEREGKARSIETHE